MSKRDGFAIACAWPETFCKEPGSWYDKLMNDIGISQNGYYRVGHAALILVQKGTGICSYYDFGRYHAPQGFGRVRNSEHDHELHLRTKAIIIDNQISNLKQILTELHGNESGHGEGPLFGTYTSIRYKKVHYKIQSMINDEFIKYGPFVPSGTNCSRFVNAVIRAGRPALDQHVLLKYPLTVSPTPMWNLRALQNDIICVGETESVQETSNAIVTQ